MSLDGARHEVILRSVERHLTQLLDETDASIGHGETLYRVALHEAKSTAKKALRALERIQS